MYNVPICFFLFCLLVLAFKLQTLLFKFIFDILKHINNFEEGGMFDTTHSIILINSLILHLNIIVIGCTHATIMLRRSVSVLVISIYSRSIAEYTAMYTYYVCVGSR